MNLGNMHIVSPDPFTQSRCLEVQAGPAAAHEDDDDGGLDSPAIADGERGQREHAAVSVAAGEMQKVAVHKNRPVHGYRFYNQSLGRWLSRDAVEEQGGMNLYVVNGNNCVNNVDLLGLSSCDILSWYIIGYWQKGQKPFGQLSYMITAKVTWLCYDCEKPCCKPQRWIKMKASINGVPITTSTSGVPLDGQWHEEPPQNLSNDHCVYQMGDTPGIHRVLKCGNTVDITGTFRLIVRDICNENPLTRALDKEISFSATGVYPDKLSLSPPGTTIMPPGAVLE